MERNGGNGLTVLLICCLVVGLFTGGVPALADTDNITPIDPATGKVLVPPGDSALAEDVTSGPPNPKPPPYTLLRYTEDYSYLANPANRTDFFDPVKYIPLNTADPASYLSLGGEIRLRFEHYTNQSFGTTGPRENNYLLQRVTLHAFVHVNKRLRIFVQGISALQYGGESKPAVNQDPINLQQAFGDYTFGNPTPNGNRFTLRGGRFEMTYGSGRLVATRAGPNVFYKFDGVQFIASSNGTTKLYGFATHPVVEKKSSFDSADYSQAFWGLYGTMPVGGPLNTTLDLYYLGFHNENARYVDATGEEDRHTVGTRVSGKTNGWDYDIEPVLQFGTVGNKDIRAWTFASDSGYTFAHSPWTPRVGAKFDVASGDNNRGNGTLGTFNPLYFKAGYFNDAVLLRPANIIDIHPNLQLQPNDSTTLTFGSDVVWRYSNQDAIYGLAGNVTLPAGLGSNYVGTTAEAAIQYSFNRHLVLTASYVYMFTGSYVAKAGGGDVNFFATWLEFLW